MTTEPPRVGRFSGFGEQRGPPQRTHDSGTSLGVALLTSCQTPRAFSQSPRDVDVALQYLKRHGVPCQSVASAAITVYMNDIITCEDGRQWVLFWLEDEVSYGAAIPRPL